MKIQLISFLLIMCMIACKAQVPDHSEVNFFNYINSDYVGIKIFKQQTDNIDYEIISPFYELNTNELKVGFACLFALSKNYPELWINEVKKGDCAKKPTYYGSLRCQAKQLFIKDTLLLKKELDLFVFFIDKKDLEGPFKEEVEGGVYENYSPKKDCMIIIYKYMQKGWVKIDSQKNVEGKIPRLFGESYIEKIAIKRINDYLNRK